jgi:hypothetical protein
MASLVLKMSVSLDGYVAPVDGSTDWIAAGGSADGLSWTVETVSNASAHLIGAATYAGWAGYWPSASGPFAKAMNEIPKVVFSNSLTSAGWGETTIAAGDHRLQRRRGRPRLHGAPVTVPGNQADTAVMPEAEIRKPLPSLVQVTPVAADSQRNGPTPVAVP